MKCLCYSNRFYYKDLSSEDVDVIKNDLVLYNSMLHTAYKRVFLSCFHGAKGQITSKQLKAKYGTSDYFPLSAIHEARGLLKGNIEINQQLIKSCKKRISKILEAIERKAFYNGVEVIQVEPAYTSMIGKLKYVRDKGLSIHQAASYVIARKGLGYKEKILREYRVFIKQEQPLVKQWEIIAKKVGKASIKECQLTAHLCLFR